MLAAAQPASHRLNSQDLASSSSGFQALASYVARRRRWRSLQPHGSSACQRWVRERVVS